MIFVFGYYIIVGKIMKKFRYNFTPTVLILIVLVILLAGAGLGWNIFNLIEYSSVSVYKTVIYAITILLTAFLIVLAVAFLVFSGYVISEEKICLYFGFIKFSTPIKDIVGAKVFIKSKKLVVYLKDGKFSVIVISPEKFDEFLKDLHGKNPSVIAENESEE